MITLPLDAFALALVGAAAIVAAFTLEGHSPLQGCAVDCLVTCALVLDMFSNTMGALDILTDICVVIFGSPPYLPSWARLFSRSRPAWAKA